MRDDTTQPTASEGPRRRTIKIVGIETSCDETAIGIVEDGRNVLSNAVASSLKLHEAYGGVIPEIAARAHVETIWEVLSRSLDEAGVTLQEIDAVAVTQGPGLPGALVVGVAFAKGLALRLGRPLIPVDHLAAHLYAGEMSDASLEPPYVGLVVSGGHTLLCVAHGECRYEVLGETRDDAVGEAFDKVAKLLGLGYPGGPIIDRLSEQGRSKAVNFPRSQTKQPFDFSFSGLKTSVRQYISKPLRRETGSTISVSAGPLAAFESGEEAVVNPSMDEQAAERHDVADIAASFQEAAVDVLVSKTLRACQRTGIKRIIVGGGVASNRRLRGRFAEEAVKSKLQVVFPPPKLCVDNGAMVAGIAYSLLQKGRVASLSLATDPSLCLA